MKVCTYCGQEGHRAHECPRRPTFRNRLRMLLEEEGPLHAREIAERFGMSPDHVRGAIGKMRATLPGQFHIAEYRREEVAGRLYPRACYAAGPGVDARRPKPLPRSRSVLNHRYKDTVKQQVNSVWALASKVNERRRIA